MANDLVTPDELVGFPGAPFGDQIVDAAVGEVRGEARWHIAPSRTETLTLDSDGGTRLVLPTLRLAAVSAVRDTSGDTPVDIADYRWSKSGILYRFGGWPCGFQAVEVDVVHGYDSCPPELLPVVAGRAQASAINWNVASRAIGPFSETYRTAAVADPALARYMLPSRP
jgi:hypothetical protein